MHVLVVASVLVLSGWSAAQRTENWPQFLGAGSAARARGADTLSFDRERDLIYRVELPRGESSPCIWGDQIFVTGFESEQQLMMALDRRTGAERWRHAVPAPERRTYMHADAGITLPTPCTNGVRVFFYFPAYGLVARNTDGELVWEKRLPAPAADFGMGSSPSLHGDTLYLLRDGCPDAKLYALDEATGKEVWSIPRLTFYDSHATPYVWKNRDRTELVIASSGTLISFDPANGKELWRVEGLSPLVCTTPTANEDRLFFAAWSTPAAAGTERALDGLQESTELTDEERSDPDKLFARFDRDGDQKLVGDEVPAGRARAAFKFLDRDADGSISRQEWIASLRRPQIGKNLLVAVRRGGAGDVTKTHVAWSVDRNIPYVSSPLLCGERLYMVKAGGILSCIDAATGEPRFRRARLGDHCEYYATPLGVDDHVVVCSSSGILYVLEDADALRVVREVDFGERIFATPAVAQGCVYVRTLDALYAFGRAK